MKNENLFKRKEKKYLLDADHARAFQDALLPYLERETASDGSAVSCRKSYYFETRDFKSYFDHRNLKSRRFKIRLRFYDAKNRIPDRGFLEMKTKHNGQTSKKRIRFNSDAMQDFLNGRDWHLPAAHLNSALDHRSLVQISDEITQTIKSLKMEIILSVLYGRECLYNNNAGLRITFDSDLRVQATRNNLIRPECNQAGWPANKVIVEIKTSKARPNWLNQLVKEFDLRRQSFSKYCYSVERLYLNGMNQSDVLNKNEQKNEEGVPIYAGISDEFAELFSIV